MGITIIDTLLPLGNFFAVEAEHVGVGEVSLNEVLNATAIELAKKVSKEYVDEKIAEIPEPDVTKLYVDSNFAKKSEIPAVPTKTSQLQNDSGFLTQHQSLAGYVQTTDPRLSDARPASDVPSWAKSSNKPNYTKAEIGLSRVDNTSDVDKPISAATQEALDSKAAKSELTEFSARVSDVETEQNVLSARMDTFEQLPEGSTTEDARLEDISVGYSGTQYNSPAEAVRGQVSDLHNNIDAVSREIQGCDSIFYDGTINPNTGKAYILKASGISADRITVTVSSNSDFTGGNLTLRVKYADGDNDYIVYNASTNGTTIQKGKLITNVEIYSDSEYLTAPVSANGKILINYVAENNTFVRLDRAENNISEASVNIREVAEDLKDARQTAIVNYDATMSPNTGRQSAVKITDVNTNKFTVYIADGIFSGGTMTLRVKYVDNSEDNIAFDMSKNGATIDNGKTISIIELYSDTAYLTGAISAKGSFKLYYDDLSDYTKTMNVTVKAPDKFAYQQAMFELREPLQKRYNITKIGVKCKLVCHDSNTNVFRVYHADQIKNTASAYAGKWLPSATYYEQDIVNGTNIIDCSFDVSGLANSPIKLMFLTGNKAEKSYNIDYINDFIDLEIYINGEKFDVRSFDFVGVRGFDNGTYSLTESFNEKTELVTNDSVETIGSASSFITMSPNTLPIGKSLDAGTRVIEKGASGSFDDGFCESPFIWWDTNKLKYGMVYTGYRYKTGSTTEYDHAEIGLAWSDDLINWTKDVGGSILQPSGIAGSADFGSVTGPVMLMVGTQYYLYYIGCDQKGYEQGTKRLCLATGSDIRNLTRHPSNPLISPTGIDTSPYKIDVYHANIVRSEKINYMFINCEGYRSTDGHISENIMLFKSKDLIRWEFDSVCLYGGTSTDAPDYQILGDPCVFDIGDGNYYMTLFRVKQGWSSPSTGLAVTSKADFPYNWKKLDVTLPVKTGYSKSFIIYRKNEIYHFVSKDDIYLHREN